MATVVEHGGARSVQRKEAVLARIRATGVVAIMRHTEASLAIEAAEALLRGGVDVVEVTLNTAGATAMIRNLATHFGDRLLVGAGTVLSPAGVTQAMEAGAQFVVAPNTDPNVINLCNQRYVPVLPGAFTPTEVVAAWETGADLVKVFPVASVGPRYIRDLRGPLPDIPLVPTGGVNLDNAAEYVKAGAVALGAGSDLVDKGLVDRREFDELERRARGFVAAVAQGRA
ncbi:MAG TPA: bifunctional 4-hydroxy-2-oxoglutarate aldolase/2-dehydro-3-deoxy-phosphogluconate aldolase [Chloroflexota bacterium]|jgi:2-dehydro-3-deoxyphosphogluconate aldolase/(4S)-4-hydroxy-2-oxoglutarate aldolase|nr:bifunctional 4-hydroxy-2-oxoglutarate aldolase/2-dehydro-3-deoxy-phosphogluconate aldolase [Chloroflexota bacterium]